MASSIDRAFLDDKMSYLASHCLTGLETWVSRTPFETEIALGYIRNCDRMVDDKYPLDKVKYLSLLQRCKGLVPSDSPLIATFDSYIERSQRVHQPDITTGFLDVLTKVIQALKDFDDTNPWVGCRIIFDAFSQFVNTYEVTTPDFWKYPFWRNYTFAAELAKFEETLTRDDSEHLDEIKQIYTQLEVWRAKIALHQLA